MLDYIIEGNTLESWLIAIAIILGAVIFMKLLSLLNQKVLRKLVRKTQTKLDDVILDAIDPPIRFAIILLGIWIALHHLEIKDSIEKIIETAYKLLTVLNSTWIFARIINGIIQVYWIANEKNAVPIHRANKMIPVIKRTIIVIVWIIGISMALSNVGINVTALLGTLGIGGIAFALAAQDTIKNIFSAFTIFTDRPFNIGDIVRIDSFEGTIIDIGIRSTKMINNDKRIIIFPNYKIADASIINISSEPRRRVVVNLGLTYDTTPQQMKKAIEILKEMPKKVDNVASDIIANFSEFADSALVINFIYNISSSGDIGLTTSNVNLQILTSFNEAGLSFAFPSRTLYIENEGKEQMLNK